MRYVLNVLVHSLVDEKAWFSDASSNISDELNPLQMVLREHRIKVKPFLWDLSDLDKLMNKELGIFSKRNTPYYFTCPSQDKQQELIDLSEPGRIELFTK